ncbi:MAG: RsmE family RNA methyltransferase [Puniceicoccaceae bacterium]
MNLILLDSAALKQKLPASDRRSIHIQQILGQACNELFVGMPGGPMGKAQVQLFASGEVGLDITWFANGEGLDSGSKALSLMVPYCRPQTCRKILRDAASLGIRRLLFFRSTKAEHSYAQSSLWRGCEWVELLRSGVEQAFTTQVPEVQLLEGGLEEAVQVLNSLEPEPNRIHKIALDNYESQLGVGEAVRTECSHFLAVGAERGWSQEEREIFRNNGFILAHMGSRVMRTETAVIAACSVISQLSGMWREDTGNSLGKAGK